MTLFFGPFFFGSGKKGEEGAREGGREGGREEVGRVAQTGFHFRHRREKSCNADVPA